MSFFEPIEPPEPPAPTARPQPKWSRPDTGALGGFVPLRLELARGPQHLVLLGPMDAHPNGVAITLRTRSRVPEMGSMYFGFEGPGALRVGVSFAEGRTTESARGAWTTNTDVGDGPILMPGGGGGGGGEYRMEFWLWPLPPPGPATFHCIWEDAGIAERSASVDASVFIDAARDAERLWEPLTPEEERAAMESNHRMMRRHLGSSAGTSFTLAHSSETDETGDLFFDE